MPKIDPILIRQFQYDADISFDLIIRTEGPAIKHLTWLAEHGFQIRHQFKLSPGVAITGYGSDASKLLEQCWVLSIERDEPLKG